MDWSSFDFQVNQDKFLVLLAFVFRVSGDAKVFDYCENNSNPRFLFFSTFTAHVLQEIFVCQFEGVVNNITSSVSLGFIDDELPPEGRNHNKVLHISIECVDTILSRVLVDTGSSLNLLPKSSLSKLTIEGLW